MKHIPINLKDNNRNYKIFSNSGLIKEIGSMVTSFIPENNEKVVILTNESIGKFYLKNLKDSFQNAGFETSVIEIKEGEEVKTISTAESVYKKLINLNADRQTLLVALGGGVIGDLTGFIAATFMRGVPYVQVPTSLLAMVDSSVGGKTGVNLAEGKNLVGVFYHPLAVFIDTDCLSTLPEQELAAGLAEVVKYGIIWDKNFFNLIENNIEKIKELNEKLLQRIIITSCKIKANVVEKDEKENNYRVILNFGHTMGHAIESLTEYKSYKHGEALSIGMVFASFLSKEMGFCNMEDCRQIIMLLKKIGLPTDLPKIKTELIINSIKHDKKVTKEKIKFILMKAIGEVEIIEDVSVNTLKKVLERGNLL